MSVENIQETLRTGPGEEPSLDQLLGRGVSTILPETPGVREHFRDLLESDRRRAYLGIDPTGPQIHIGHGVPLRKLHMWQQLGHEAILLFGGFTATIGDPKAGSVRTKLSKEQVEVNMADYSKQAGKVLDMSPDAPNKVKIVNNYDWLSQMGFGDVVDLASNFTVQQMLSHVTYKERIEQGKPLSLHEIMYFLMQAEDAKHLQIDMQVGGTEQTFNIAAGITLIKRALGKESFGVVTKLITDAKGNKMGKTEGNVVALVALPEVKYEAVMGWPDGVIPSGFELLSNVRMEQVAAATLAVSEGRLHPNDLKRALAFRMTAELDGVNEAVFAEAEYNRVYRDGQLPSRIQEVHVGSDTSLTQVLVESGLATDPGHAEFLIRNRSIRVDGEIAKASRKLQPGENIVSIGKRTIANIRRITVQ